MSKSKQAYPEDLFEVTDGRQVEILARCGRVWVDKRTLDPEAMDLAEFVLKVCVWGVGGSV